MSKRVKAKGKDNKALCDAKMVKRAKVFHKIGEHLRPSSLRANGLVAE